MLLRMTAKLIVVFLYWDSTDEMEIWWSMVSVWPNEEPLGRAY